ncbi:HAD hydrolase-like protein [Streptomyces sp. NPDC048389]|uniref:HAD family hydrolase n=1 Tax=Streptomyces sp. NPDC048389 TaxID=3154622 RepID=UPI0034511AEF
MPPTDTDTDTAPDTDADTNTGTDPHAHTGAGADAVGDTDARTGTGTGAGGDDRNPAWVLLSGASLVVLDFDKIVCDLFVRSPADRIAERLRELAGSDACHGAGATGLADPLVVFTRIHATYRHTAPGLVTAVKERLDAEEVAAAESAARMPGAAALMEELTGLGKEMAVVSNNCELAVQTFLKRHDLEKHITAGVVGRPDAPELMKPDPFGLLHVLHGSGVRPVDSVMVGDSRADAGAAQRVGMPFLGVHPDEGRWRRPEPVEVAHAVPDMTSLLPDFVAARRV